MSAYADLGTLWLNIGVKNKVNEEFKQIENTVTDSAKRVEDLGKKFTKYLTVPLTGLGTLAIREFANFESAMSKVQATTSATGDEMGLLTAKARELGKSTIYSAEEVAQAMNYMAMAGWDTTQIIDGLDGVLSLAVASGEDLANVSDIVTDALTAFGLKASDTQDFVDLLANTARTANTNVSLLGESFKYVAPVSASLGISAEQTALALGLLANNGIKGSQAGTTLRAALNQLIKPSKEAASLMKEYGIAIQTADDGSVDLMGTVESLKNGISNLEKTQQAQVVSTLVGTEAMSGMMALINATEADVNKLTEATTNYKGSAQEMADTMNNNVKGNLNKLKSAFSELLIVIGENLVPMFTKLVEKVTDIIEWFSSLDEGTQEFIVNMGLLSAAIGPVLSVVGKLSSALGPLNGGLTGVGGSAGGLVTTLVGSSGLSSALGSLVTVLTGPVGVALLAATGGFLALNHHANETAVLSFDDTLKNIDGLSSATTQMVSTIKSDWDELNHQTQQMMNNQETITVEGLEALKTNYITHFDELIELEQTNGNERLDWLQQKYEESEGEQRNYYYRLLLAEQEALGEGVSHHEANKQEVLQIMSELAEGKITNTQEAMNRIQEIIAESTASEVQNSIDKGEELLVLAQNFGALEDSLRAEQASKIIQDANVVKDEKIAAANDAYGVEVKNILSLTTITQDERKKMLSDAETRKNEEIRIAHEQKMGIVDELGKAYPELSRIVNYETGEIRGSWSQMWSGITRSHETEMQMLVKNAGEDLGDVTGYYNEMSEKAGRDLNNLVLEQQEVGKNVILMGQDIKTASEITTTNVKGPINSFETLKQKINAVPGRKTVEVIINETTRKRTEVYGTTTNGRSAISRSLVDEGFVTFHDALYNMTAFNTGFNPSGDIARYDSVTEGGKDTQSISTKGIEERLEKLAELFEQFKELKVYLDKYTLIGELAPGMSKQLMKGVRPR